MALVVTERAVYEATYGSMDCEAALSSHEHSQATTDSKHR